MFLSRLLYYGLWTGNESRGANNFARYSNTCPRKSYTLQFDVTPNFPRLRIGIYLRYANATTMFAAADELIFPRKNSNGTNGDSQIYEYRPISTKSLRPHCQK
jgi:hypothetical protein